MLFCCHCNNCYSGNSRTNAARFAYITQHWLADTSDGQTFAYPSIGHNNNESKILLWCVASGVIGLGFGIFFVLSRNSSPRKCIIKSFTSLRGTRRSKSYIVEYRKTIIRVQKICIHTLRELHPRCAMCEVMFYSGHFTARPAPTTTTRPLCEGRRLTFHSPHHSQQARPRFAPTNHPTHPPTPRKGYRINRQIVVVGFSHRTIINQRIWMANRAEYKLIHKLYVIVYKQKI